LNSKLHKDISEMRIKNIAMQGKLSTFSSPFMDSSYL
jgi:hypothetical protein